MLFNKCKWKNYWDGVLVNAAPVNIEATRLNILNVGPGDLKPSDIIEMREDLSIEKFGIVDYPVIRYLKDKEVLNVRAPHFDWQSVQFRGAYWDQFDPLPE